MPGRSARWRYGAVVSLLVAVLAAMPLLPHLGSSTELVRLRHALVLGPELSAEPEWSPPAAPPAGFRTEVLPASRYFADLSQRLGLGALANDRERVQAIATHLLGSQPVRRGGAVKADLAETHRRIVELGDGYCGDFVRVFMAIAHAAGLTVRPWAFSFDGYGGHGHIWVDVWNRDRRAWELVDIFNNYYFTDRSGERVSAMQFRAALAHDSTSLRLHPLAAVAPVGYAIESKAWDYFRRGLPQWYAIWGNDVFTYDASALVRAFAPGGRGLEQFGAIAQGVYPQIRILSDPRSASAIASLRELRARLEVVALLWVAACVSAVLCTIMWYRSGPRHALIDAAAEPVGHG